MVEGRSSSRCRRSSTQKAFMRQGGEMASEEAAYSYCLLFLALVAFANQKRSFHELLFLLPIGDKVRRLGHAVASW